MSADRVERLRVLLEGKIATAEAAEADDFTAEHWPVAWAHRGRSPVRAFIADNPPSQVISLARADLVLIEEHSKTIEIAETLDDLMAVPRRNNLTVCNECFAPSLPCPFLLSRCDAWNVE